MTFMTEKLVFPLAGMITARKTTNKLLLFNRLGRIIEIRLNLPQMTVLLPIFK